MNMIDRCTKVLLGVGLLALISAPAFAQGTATSSIQGVVVDSGGGVIPGATVTATNDATAGVSTVITAANGTFTIPALNVGTYTVNVTLQGFKTAVLKGVVVSAGAPASVRAVLEIGGLTETVVVEGASEVIQTQSSAAATTINTRQIMSLPVASRSTLDFVTFLPGVNTPGGSRDSTVNGLPQSSINITVDGVSVQDNYLKTTDGFFARMSPRLDAIEEVTVTTAGNGADASSQGSTQIRFTTRSGTNAFSGSSYHYYQSDKLNTNTYFNKVRGLPKNVAVQYQPGTRVGGPIVIPGVYDGRGKAFFFVNYEENRTPRTITTNSNVLTQEAFNGVFRYQTSAGVREVNLFTLAANNGQVATYDPVVLKLLQDINAATASGGVFTDLDGNFQARRFSFQQDAKGTTRYPTVRVDYNLSNNHRLNASWNFNDLVSRPDTTNTRQLTFPGFPVVSAQISDRYTFQTSLRSTLSSNLVNELRYGMSGGATLFSPDLTKDMWNGPVANQMGFHLGISAAGIANAGSASVSPSSREATTKFVDTTLNWLRGAHSIRMGGTYTQADVWLLTETRVPSITLGLPSGHPAVGMFNTTNFPGSATGDRTAAQNLYAVLTGNVSAIAGTARLDAATGKYVYNGDSRQEGRLRQIDFFLQDDWKVRPNLSLNVGLRYLVQLPFYAINGTYSTATLDDVWGISGFAPGCNPSDATPDTCNLFKPGLTPGNIPTYQNLGAGVKAYNTDWNNWSPSIGVNWTPGVEGGWLRKLLGEQGDTSFSAGWARAYERHGMSDFTGVFGANPGLTANANRNVNNGNLGAIPLLLRDGYLGPPATCVGAVTPACIPEAPSYPIPTTVTGSINIFDPDLQVPYSDSWTAGIQRAIGRGAAIEIRYVGTRNREQWTTYNYNETNIIENGFFEEFKLAQANLYANIAAGRGENFRYFGPGTGTSPLPIYLAYFSGIPSSQAADPARYTSASFASSDFVNPLSRYAPNPFTHAGTNANAGLNGSATRRANAIAAGLPANFFVANPNALGGANVTGNGGYTKYNGLQVQFRRRLSGGLQFDANYSTGRGYQSSRYSFRVPRELTRDTGGEGDVTHAWKGTFVYELPFGEGRRFMAGANRWVDGFLGGWQVSGTARVQTSALIDLGNVRVIGMSEDDVRDLFRFRRVGPDEMYMWPQDIIDNTIRAYSRNINGYTLGEPTGRYFAPANGPDCIETIAAGYGQCGVRSLVITGPIFRTMDLAFSKEIRISGKKNVQIRVDLLNAFDAVNFTAEDGVGSTTLAGWQISGANSGRVMQIVTRFNF